MMEERLQYFYTEKLPGYLDFLEQMVTTNSFTANPAGVNRLGNLIAEEFAHLGFQAESVQSHNPDFGKHLVLIRKGLTSKKVGLITHLDTVFPPEEEAEHDFSWLRRRPVNDELQSVPGRDQQGGGYRYSVCNPKRNDTY